MNQRNEESDTTRPLSTSDIAGGQRDDAPQSMDRRSSSGMAVVDGTPEGSLREGMTAHAQGEGQAPLMTEDSLESFSGRWQTIQGHFVDEPKAAVEEADGLIFMGGPMSVNDDLPYIRQELRLIEAAAARGKPVLGVCLGAQLIARALGGRVYRNAVKEIGWYPVRFTGAARTDRLFADLSAPELVFHWHGETFDLPPLSLSLCQAWRTMALGPATATV